MPSIEQYSLLDERKLRKNFLALNDWVHDGYFNLWVDGPSLTDVSGTSVGATNSTNYRIFPDASTTEASVNLRRPERWFDGSLDITILYTGSVSSTNNIRWAPLGAGVADGATVAPTPTAVAIVSAGPATANLLKVGTKTQLIADINSSHDFILVSVTREGGDAGDTYAGDARLIGIRLTYVPARL